MPRRSERRRLRIGASRFLVVLLALALGPTDLVGSPVMAVSQAGATTTPVHRDPYGGARPGSTSSPGIGFAGEWADPTGLLNLRARAYDPAAGRFAARDTFGGVASAPQTANRYAYALNNPYRYTDPSGRFVQAVIDNPGLVASLILQAIPFVGDAYSGLTGVLGYDPLAGITLTELERNLAFAAVLPWVPGVASAARVVGKATKRAVGVAADVLVGVGRRASGALAAVARVPRRVAAWAGDVVSRARGAGRASDTAAPARKGSEVPRYVYRGGSNSPDNLTPRRVDTGGLSTFDSIEAATPPGGKAQKIDTARLRSLLAIPDPPPAGHVSIRPPSLVELEDWMAARGTGVTDPFAAEVRETIVDVVWRQK